MSSPKQWYYVTGCDSGFGRILAKKLDRLGHGVFAGVYLEKSIDELRGEGSNIFPIQVDVTNDESVSNAAQQLSDHLDSIGKKGLDGVVNNAGILINPGPVEWTPIENYKRMFDVNVLGVVRVTKSVLPLIRAARGRVVNIASIAGRVGLPTEPAYCVSKYGVEAFSDVLRIDMLPFDVTVSIVEPGVFKNTALYGNFQTGLDKLWNNLPQSLKDDYGEDYYKYQRELMTYALNNFSNTDNNLVPNACIHALTNDRPQYRYRVGPDSKYAISLMEKVHESTHDAMLTASNPQLPTVHPKTAARDASGKLLSAHRRYEKNWGRFILMIAAAIFVAMKLRARH